MAWTVPSTFVDGYPLTAAQLNTLIRDNLLETAPAKAIAATNGYFVTETPNRIGYRAVVKATSLDLNGGSGSGGSLITSSDYSDPTAKDASTPGKVFAGPTVICQTGVKAMVLFACGMNMRTSTDGDTGRTMRCSVDVSGATTRPAADSRSIAITPTYLNDGTISYSTSMEAMGCVVYDGLVPGEHTFTMKYRCQRGVGRVYRRKMIVIPF